ncbi:MAG TPA: SWIM zinc finger family protein, partial [Kofleriaceae bacterium]
MLAITVDRLRSQVDALTFARGQQYWREGRVLAVSSASGLVVGTVRGSERYQVTVHAQRGGLIGTCTCPIGAACKHVVAVLLAHLEGAAPVAEPVAGERFATRDDVDRWAEEHHVGYALGLSGEVLAARLPRDPWLAATLSRTALREVASLVGARRVAGARGFATELARAAAAALDAEAASVETGLAEEHTAPLAPSVAEALPLWAKVSELRAAVRRQAVPRSRAWRSTARWKLDARGAAIVWDEPQRIYVTTHAWGTFAVQTTLTFAHTALPSGSAAGPGQARPVEVSGVGSLACSCRAPGARCVHALALLDATLDRLADPALADDTRALAAELLRPSWERALLELDKLDAIAAKPKAAVEVWWAVEEVMGAITLTPIVKKQARHGGWTSGARMSAARLMADHGEQLAAEDMRIARELVAWNQTIGTYPSRAFAAAVGHARVVADDDVDEPMPLVRVPLGFAALASGDQLVLEPQLGGGGSSPADSAAEGRRGFHDGTRVRPEVLAELLRGFRPGEPLLVRDPVRARFLLVDVGDEARAVWSVIERHGPVFPPESHGRLLERLGRLEQRVPIHVPQIIKGRELQAELVTVVRLRLLPDVTLELELFVRPGEGAPLYPPGAGPTDVLLSRGGERGYVRRQLATEQARARELLARLPMDGAEEAPPGCFSIRDTDAALALIAALQSPPAGLEAQWNEPPPSVAPSPVIDDIRVGVRHEHDWFGIVGDVKHEAGRLELAVLLDAARRQQKYV